MICERLRIAEGATSEVFVWGENQVLKLYRDGFPPDEAEQEARRARAAASSGIPTPAVIAVVTVEGRQGVVFERVEGPTLLQTLLAHPDQCGVLAEEMAVLQAAMHSSTVSGLSSQHERLQRKIRGANGLSESSKERLLTSLDRLPNDKALCHGDFHPNNIVLTERGPVLIDWVDATEGHPLADVARSRHLLLTASLPDTAPAAQRSQVEQFRALFCEAYLLRYDQLRPHAREELDDWLPLVAAARLSERLSSEETDTLLKIANSMHSEAS